MRILVTFTPFASLTPLFGGAFYFFTCFTIDTSLLRALLAHHGKAFSELLRRCGRMIPICWFWVFALSLSG